jgi:hypothetical protein
MEGEFHNAVVHEKPYREKCHGGADAISAGVDFGAADCRLWGMQVANDLRLRGVLGYEQSGVPALRPWFWRAFLTGRPGRCVPAWIRERDPAPGRPSKGCVTQPLPVDGRRVPGTARSRRNSSLSSPPTDRAGATRRDQGARTLASASFSPRRSLPLAPSAVPSAGGGPHRWCA